MHIPVWFQEALQRQFGGRYQVRWSEARGCAVIDEKVARGHAITPTRLAEKLRKLDPAVAAEYETRLRNGTQPYVEVFPGSQAPCPACGARVRLQSRLWVFAHCEACGKDFKAVHYDLGELLLETLRYQDIYQYNSAENLIADMDRANEDLKRTMKRDDHNYLEAIVHEDWKDINGIDRTTRLSATRAARTEPLHTSADAP